MRIRTLFILAAGTALVGCSQAPEPEAPAAEPQTQAAPEPAPAPAALPRQPSPEGATLYFIAPADGDEVTGPVTVVFGLSGAGVAPAGIDLPNTGHHHVLVDTDVPPLGLPVPADENHVHFGLGQTEATLDLAPGEHTLQLILGDHLHIPHDPPLLSEQITITVVE